MSRKKAKTKTRKPLTISIHGQDLDIEAKIGDGLADVLTEAIARATSTRAKVEPAATSPLAELISEFGTSLRKEQLELLMTSFDTKQKILFMEIMNVAAPAHAEN